MAPKGRPERAGSRPAGGEGDFVIALRTRNVARTPPARRAVGEVVRMTPLLVAWALSGCAPVGPNFERPAAIVSPQFKEIKGWKIATPRANEPKGAGAPARCRRRSPDDSPVPLKGANVCL